MTSDQARVLLDVLIATIEKESKERRATGSVRDDDSQGGCRVVRDDAP